MTGSVDFPSPLTLALIVHHDFTFLPHLLVAVLAEYSPKPA